MRKHKLHKFTRLIPVFITLSIIGCGLSTTSIDESISGNQDPANNSIEGIASAGAPLNGIIFLKASDSAMSISTTVDDSGYYAFHDNEIDSMGGTPPFILKVDGSFGGKNKTLYSIARNRGRVNLNPISDLALSLSALNNNPEQVFENTSLIPSQASYETSLNNIKLTISPLLLELELNDIDPIYDVLKSDGTGFDAIFDLVKFESLKSNSGKVTSVVFKDYSGADLGNSDVGSLDSLVLDSVKLLRLKDFPDNFMEIRHLLKSFETSLNATSVTSIQLNSLFNSKYTTHSGRTKSQFIDYLIQNNPANSGVPNQSLVDVKNLVIVEQVDSSNNKFKIDFKYIYSGGSQISPSDPFYVQKLDGEWKFTSNNKLSDISNIYPLTRSYKDTDGVYKMFSGIHFEVWDHNNHFDNVLISGAGLPINGIELEKSPDNPKRLILTNSLRNMDLPMDQDSFYTMDDETISRLEVDQQITVSVRNSSNETIEKRLLNLSNKPLLLDNWDPSYFPTINGLQSHSILEANIGNNLDFTYSAPSITPQTVFFSNEFLTKIEVVGSSEESKPDRYYVLSSPNNNSLSASITSSLSSSPQKAALELNMVDGTGRFLSTKYIFGKVQLSSRLTGCQQSPIPVNTTSIATATINLTAGWDQMQVSLDVQNMSSASSLYIRYGEAGTTGPILFNLGSFANQKLVTFTFDDLIRSPANNINTFVDAMNAVISGKTYITIDTDDNPSGHIRGQVGSVYFKAELDARNTKNTSNSSATGVVHIQTNGMQDRVYFRISSVGISNVTAIVVGRGIVGQDLGDVIAVAQAQNEIKFPLNKVIGRSDFIEDNPAGVQNFAEMVSYLNSGGAFLNIKTPSYSSGEIRGQIGPFKMTSELLASNVVPEATGTESANGTFSLNFNASQTIIVINLTANSLISNPTSANIKIGKSGIIGNSLFNLSRGVNEPSLNVYSKLSIDDLSPDAPSMGINKFTDVVRLIESQSSYVDINTVIHAVGILRGQVVPLEIP